MYNRAINIHQCFRKSLIHLSHHNRKYAIRERNRIIYRILQFSSAVYHWTQFKGDIVVTVLLLNINTMMNVLIIITMRHTVDLGLLVGGIYYCYCCCWFSSHCTRCSAISSARADRKWNITTKIPPTATTARMYICKYGCSQRSETAVHGPVPLCLTLALRQRATQ